MPRSAPRAVPDGWPARCAEGSGRGRAGGCRGRGTTPGWAGGPAAGQMLTNRLGHKFLERRLDLPPTGGPAQLLVMPRRRQAGGLVDHDHVVVKMHDSHVPRSRRLRGGRLEDLHHLPILEPAGRVGADVAVDQHMPRSHERLHVRPARRGQPAAEESGNREARFGGGHVEDCAWMGFHEAMLDRFSRGFTLCGEVVRQKPPRFPRTPRRLFSRARHLCHRTAMG